MVVNKKSLLPPLTFGAVAAYASATQGRVLRMELPVALFGAAVGAWFFVVAWNPVIQESIQRLPDGNRLNQGQLEWAGDAAARLGANRFLAIGVNLTGTGQPNPLADLRLELGRTGIKIASRLGHCAVQYPRQGNIPFNRQVVDSQWKANQSLVVGGIGAGMFVGLMLGWAGLAAIYSTILRAMGFAWLRSVAWMGCWRLASAALMPGALWMIAAIVLYGLQFLDWRGFVVAFVLHFVVGWVYLLVGIRRADCMAQPRV